MRVFLSIFGFVAVVFVSGPLSASENLFRVAVPVASQSSAEFAKAASLGLRQVIIRMAGSPTAVDSDVIRQAYNDAQSYIEQFHYEPYSPPEHGDEERPDAEELLIMTFSQQVIERLLREAGQAYWPPNRPPVLVWLVKDGAQGKVLVNNRDAAVVAGLLQGARDRGLEIRLPLLDLEDQLALPAWRVWQMDEEAVEAASERYEVGTLLIGRYFETSRGQWRSTWQFLHRGAKREYDLQADTGYELGQQAIKPLANYLAGLYAISPQASGRPQLVVRLSGIENFGDYRQALDYLLGLAAVSDIRLHKASGDTLLLHLQIDGGLETLRNVLALDKKLQPLAVPGVNANTPPWLRVQEGTPERPVAYVWAE